jgi:hypothetical protein
MSQLRPYPLDNNQNSFLSSLGQSANSHRLLAGNGITVTQTAHGVQVSANQSRDINYTRNRGYYDFTAEYWPNDIIYVSPIVTYTDQNSQPINVPAGGYICTTHVPSSTNTSVFFLGSIVPSITNAGGQATNYEANNYRWYGNNNYYPVTPTATGSIATTVTVSGFSILTSQSFWQPIGGAGGSATYVIYDENAAISKGTTVRVPFNRHYSRSFFGTGSDGGPPLCAGTFFCVTDVPATVSGSRPAGNYYFPFFPYWDDSHTVTVSGSTYNQIFFREISPYNIVYDCVNGATDQGFADDWSSGSVFSFAFPYTG